ncbi:MAG: hypothetical protein RLZ51_2239, partial [Pseudomonadota bacterium]
SGDHGPPPGHPWAERRGQALPLQRRRGLTGTPIGRARAHDSRDQQNGSVGVHQAICMMGAVLPGQGWLG